MRPDIRPEHVQAARRALALRSLADFACMVDIPTAPLGDAAQEDGFSVMRLGALADHHRLLCDCLQALEAGEIQNLMVLMPPGSAKSTYTDVVFVPWFLARKPRRNVILASYASEIAEKQGRRARQLIGSTSFRNLTGLGLRSDNRAVHQWTLDNGSEFMAGGLLSGLTGNRAALGVIDDPMRGREAAQSQTIRDKTWDAYTDDFCSRLIPGAPQAMILTRWHEDDPAGRILPEGWDGESGPFDGRDGRRWHVICLPAEADRADDPLGRKLGETLWPQWFSAAHWAPFKLNRRTWSSLYQQKPKPGEGDIFRPAMIEIVPALPSAPTQWCRGWDFAGSTDGDWTAGPKLGRLSDGRFVIADVQRERFLADKRDAMLRNTAQADGPGVRISIPQDPGQAGKSQVLYLTRQLAGYSVHSSPETGDKVTRAEPFASQVNVGNVLMLRAPWNKALLDELRAFPNGTYDDQVDGLSRAFAQLIDTVALPMRTYSPAGL